jgi:hypothetical protein
MKVRISSWMFAVVFLLAGVWTFVGFPKFRGIYDDMLGERTVLPFVTRLVLGITPFGWFVFAFAMAALLVVRDVRSRPRLMPNWAAFGILFVSVLIVAFALLRPLVGVVGGMGTGTPRESTRLR